MYDNSIQISTPEKSILNQSKIVSFTLNEVSEIIQLRDLSYDHTPTVEEIFEVANEPLITSIQYLLQKKTSEWQETLMIHWDKNI